MKILRLQKRSALLVLTLLLLLRGLFLSHVLAVESASPPHVALIPVQSGRPVGDIFLAQIEAALSKEPAFGLLERRQIDRILKERELKVSGFASSRGHELGALLGADLLVFLEKLPNAQRSEVQVRIVESRSGLILGHLEESEITLTLGPGLVGTAIKSAIEKSRVPTADRHYVGLMGFRSEEIGKSLDGLVRALDT